MACTLPQASANGHLYMAIAESERTQGGASGEGENVGREESEGREGGRPSKFDLNMTPMRLPMRLHNSSCIA